MSGRVLIVDDIVTNRMVLSAKLEAAYYDVDEARSGAEALDTMARTPPDVALVDVMMPGMDGYELCRRIKAEPAFADIPVVIVTTLDAREDRLAALEAGADEFLTKPVRDIALLARLRSLMRMKAMIEELRLRDQTLASLDVAPITPRLIAPRPNARVITASSGRNGAHIAGLLTDRIDIDMVLAETARGAFDLIAEASPEALMLDATGFVDFSSPFCTALRQKQGAREAAQLALIDIDDLRTAAACLDAGANDYAMWPLDASELTARLRSQLRYKAYADHLRNALSDGLALAVTDSLTGLRNRRYLDSHLDRMIARAGVEGSPLSVLAFDLDRFKAVNDTWGHATGDAVLREFGRRLGANTRSVDLLARTGGEEFVAVMPDADYDAAHAAAERVRAAIEAEPFVAGDAHLALTVSVGVARLRPSDGSAAPLLERADAALYAAKKEGRNRVTLAAA